MKFKKVGTGTVEYVQEVGCSNGCSKVIPINKGLPLPCKEYTLIESALLRKRALEDEQLFASGFTQIVERSAVGSDLKIKNFGIDVGEIRTEASGARGLTECKYNFEGIEIDDFEKTFYVVNTNKHIEICPRKFVGSKLQNMIGDKMTDFDEFSDTDLADIIISQIIEKYQKEFVAKFILLAVYESEGENMNGDDGIFAKAWYAHKGQYFHTVQYSYINLVAGKRLEGIVGGNKYSKSLTDVGGSESLLLLDFVSWINGLKEKRDHLYNASVDLTSKKVTVVSRFACAKIRLRTSVLDETAVANWGGAYCAMEDTVPTEVLQNAMPINDVPLLFRYQEINEGNFVSLFKRYTKEFLRYLHRNGFSDTNIDDIKIGIDPELMLEKDDAVCGKYLAGGMSIDFMNQIGLSDSRFVPLNALSGTGLFFMTIEENIMVFGDTENEGNGLPGTGQVMVKDGCEGNVQFIFDNPIGSSVEDFGRFAANLCDSWFVEDNKLDSRQPYEATRKTLACYCDECENVQLSISCDISGTVESSIAYDEKEDETKITVTVTPNNPGNVPNVIYDIGYSLSDGTSQTGIDEGSFVVTIPGDQTETGYILNVFGTIGASNTKEGIPSKFCTSSVNHTTQFGSGSGVSYCDHTVTKDKVQDLENPTIEYVIGTETTVIPFVDNTLNFNDTNDHSAIEDEIEAIFPGSMVLIEVGALGTEVTIENVLSVIDSIVIKNDIIFDGNPFDFPLINGCDSVTGNTK